MYSAVYTGSARLPSLLQQSSVAYDNTHIISMLKRFYDPISPVMR